MKLPPDGALVLVMWSDAMGAGRDWLDLSEIVKAGKPCTVKSVGYLYRAPGAVVVVPNIITKTSGRKDGCGDMTIPVGCIERIKRLR